jgi:hypothetical protein
MTPEAQQIAIAEACGVYLFDGYSGLATNELHDYLNDLNAIQSAALQRLTTANEVNRFQIWLSRLTVRYGKTFYQLTATDWCEAFLRTLGLWTDTKGS